MPITIIIPHCIDAEMDFRFEQKIRLKPGIPASLFLCAPLDASYAKCEIKFKNGPLSHFELQIMQKQILTKVQMENTKDSAVKFFFLRDGFMEMCLTKDWMSKIDVDVNMEVTFFGSKCAQTLITVSIN